jgi:streptomycin 6-kinase
MAQDQGPLSPLVTEARRFPPIFRAQQTTKRMRDQAALVSRALFRARVTDELQGNAHRGTLEAAGAQHHRSAGALK